MDIGKVFKLEHMFLKEMATKGELWLKFIQNCDVNSSLKDVKNELEKAIDLLTWFGNTRERREREKLLNEVEWEATEELRRMIITGETGEAREEVERVLKELLKMRSSDASHKESRISLMNDLESINQRLEEEGKEKV